MDQAVSDIGTKLASFLPEVERIDRHALTLQPADIETGRSFERSVAFFRFLAIHRDPERRKELVDIYRRLSRFYQGLFTRANSAYGAALPAYKDRGLDPEANRVYEDVDRAYFYVQRALELDPDNFQALNERARIQGIRDGNGSRLALADYEASIERNRNHQRAHHGRAYELLQFAPFEEGVHSLNMALSLTISETSPSSPDVLVDIHFNRACCHSGWARDLGAKGADGERIEELLDHTVRDRKNSFTQSQIDVIQWQIKTKTRKKELDDDSDLRFMLAKRAHAVRRVLQEFGFPVTEGDEP